ncbi:MAG: dihydropteroate synthase [Actinobacteria bacterium]|jgi:dihydropteroate synthase|uniref:dihydropteroate synthase n=1 Tax=freshwater metagenome TaxID=449393 RepID=A0A6J7BIQ4_9ZZZZ|nr:dihydropteroate synthase [Actinomycetota bacterium]MSY52325.1 dihydropteroate synthase [Actinomycetota bacterium]MSY88171.1 dihydropteroate synthase [Actinomycetota bacterium]MTA50606.1 dihydropteroate synthase [Actinomycetota bacterium]NBP91745.1 dihydropteroate synthase [Actinomycetota bacterium]
MRVLGLPEFLHKPKRTLVMGIINVTPDSFSDGGENAATESAVMRGIQMIREGVDIIDIGGESTRPGAPRISAEEEKARVLPVLRALSDYDTVLSIDTMRAEVAEEAIAAGASIVNDVSGGLADSDMPRLIADVRVPYVVMHWRGFSDSMQKLAVYEVTAKEVRHELAERIEKLTKAGVEIDQLILDPGLGFAKEPDHNWDVLQAIESFEKLKRPLLVGASRKRFLGTLLNDGEGDRDVKEREAATIAVTTMLAERKVWGVRVHNVRDSRDAIEVVTRWGKK